MKHQAQENIPGAVPPPQKSDRNNLQTLSDTSNWGCTTLDTHPERINNAS